MNIEEDVIETLNKTIKFYGDLDILYNSKEPCPEIRAIRWIITAYEKEKEYNKALLQCLKDSQERDENEHLFLGNPNMYM